MHPERVPQLDCKEKYCGTLTGYKLGGCRTQGDVPIRRGSSSLTLGYEVIPRWGIAQEQRTEVGKKQAESAESNKKLKRDLA